MTPTVLNTATLVALVVQVLLPLLVGLVTKMSTHSGLKALLLLLLTALSSYFLEWTSLIANHVHFDWVGYLITVAINFVISVAVHYGFWTATGVTAVVQSSLVKDRSAPPPAQ